jgi:hypothetical protein
MSTEINYDDWHAVHDHITKMLRVSGSVPANSFVSILEPSDGPPMINPQMLMLDLRIFPNEELSSGLVGYEQTWDDEGIQYTEVGIRIAGHPETPPHVLKIEDVYLADTDG